MAVVICAECIHRPQEAVGWNCAGDRYEFPDDVCPMQCPDHWYDKRMEDDFFCAYGEREVGHL